MKEFHCVYCGNLRSKRSEEHIIPDSLGGTLTIKDVCERCNSEIGSNIDAKFVDSEHMLFLRYRYMDFLPQGSIPDFRVDVTLFLENSNESIPGYLSLSKRGIEFQTKFFKKVTGDKIYYYLPNTPEGKEAFEGIKKSKNIKVKIAEWLPLPTLPSKIELVKEVRLPMSLEIFKIFLGYLAFKISPSFALDKRFDLVREFIQGNRSDLKDDPYRIRTGDAIKLPNASESISHEIGFHISGGYSLFYVILFDCLLFEVDLHEKIKVLPITCDKINLKRKRKSHNLDFLKVLNLRYE